MRAAGERTVPAAAAAAAAFAALFFAGGSLAPGPLVWIGAIAVLGAAAALWWWTAQGLRATVYVACLWGLAVWCGLSILWSASPDRSWGYTNETLAYAAFATLGVAVGPSLERVAAAATLLVAAVVGWALLTKCVPSLYSPPDGAARLRAPVDEWNMLALVCVAGVPLALWLARRARVAGVVLLYASVVALLLTYSRFGVALAILAGVAWVLREDEKVERIGDGVVAAAAGAVVALVAASLDGITSDGQPHGVRVHDGWIFLLVLLAGGLAAALAAAALGRVPLDAGRRRAVERAAAAVALLAVLAGLVVAGVNGSRIWHSLTSAQTTSTRSHLLQGGGGNRWQWWKEAWHGFTDHPLGGTGAGTFKFTDLRYRRSTDVTADEPHNTPLQFLSETGLVGFLLVVGAVVAALWTRRRGPLPLVLAAFAAHSLVNYDWSFLAVGGPFLFVGGVVASEPRAVQARARRPLLAAAAAAVFALGVVYSFAAPWLSQRAYTSLHLRQAHSYDPLNTDVLALQAELSLPAQGERLYKEALQLEPTSAVLWFDLATFYAENGDWSRAYGALSKAYVYDPFGPAGQCGIAQQIRKKAGARSATCRGAGQPSTP
jgi:hypothetical protein